MSAVAGWSREGGVITLRMSPEDYELLQSLLAFCAAEAMANHPVLFRGVIALSKRLNDSNPGQRAPIASRTL